MNITDPQAFYESLVADGMAPAFAEILALQSPPGANTSRERDAPYRAPSLRDSFDDTDDRCAECASVGFLWYRKRG